MFQPIVVQTKEDATQQQVHVVLHVVHSMRAMLMQSEREHEAEAQPLDGEAHVAATSTLIKACGRLDAILDDKGRWTLGEHNTLHKAITEVHEMQKRVLQAQLDLAEMHRRPSFQLRPRIATYGQKYFIAFWGNITEPGMAIIGRGTTPDAALLDFDDAFRRTPQQQFQMISDLLDGRKEAAQNPPEQSNEQS